MKMPISPTISNFNMVQEKMLLQIVSGPLCCNMRRRGGEVLASGTTQGYNLTLGVVKNHNLHRCNKHNGAANFR